jgi:hypothetical protein
MALFYGIFVIYCAGVGKCGELGVLFENLWDNLQTDIAMFQYLWYWGS